MTSIENPDVARVFDRYPEPMRKKLLHLRQIILDTASETEGSTGIQEKGAGAVRDLFQLQHFTGRHVQRGLQL